MHVVICDENESVTEHIAQKLTEICRNRDTDLEVQVFHSLNALFFQMEDDIQDVDLMILEMDYTDDMTGVDVALRLRIMGYEKEIIFASHDKEQVFDSFDANPFHYIVKDETGEDKVDDILERVITKLEAGRREIISLTCAGERRNIPLRDIRYFEVDKRIIRVHYQEKEQFEFYSTIGKLENLLLGKGFVRVHRAFLVSLHHVAQLTAAELVMDTGDRIPLGRTYSKAVRDAFREYVAFQGGAGSSTAGNVN